MEPSIVEGGMFGSNPLSLRGECSGEPSIVEGGMFGLNLLLLRGGMFGSNPL